jgi:alpha-L-rhamnosidase
MKFFAPVALFVLAVLAGPAAAQAAPLVPTQLRCEYQVNPLGIDETAPRLSWQFESKARAVKQTAYQVLVATSVEALERGEADLWDSGRVESDQSTQVVYRGKPLTSGLRCYWQVRTWDQQRRAGRYSPPAYWEMGLLKQSDWVGKWIGVPSETPREAFSMEGARWVWYPEGDPVRSAPKGTRYFRRVFTIPARREPTRAVFYAAADNHFTLYVNGREAGRGSGWQSALPIDILNHLRIGENVLALSASNADEAGGPAAVTGRLLLQFSEGPPLTLDVDGTWKAQDGLAEPGL